MKWQQIAILLSLAVGATGAVSYLDLFGGLFQINGMNYTYSGDMKCADICEAYINVTTSYYNICFEHSNKSEVLYKKSALSRTLWVNLNNVDTLVSTTPEVSVDWFVPALGNKWRTVKDGDCWVRGKVNRIKLIGHKQPSQTVKWGFKLNSNQMSFVDIDPKWEGVDNLSNLNPIIVKHEFTPTTEKMEYSDGTGNIIISSGQIYANSLGTRLENARSLKDCEFCDGLKMNINLDKKFNVTIEDYNYTDFKNVCFMSTDIGHIPLKINLLSNKSAKQLDIKVATTVQTVNKWRCYNFTVPTSILDYEIEWGWNSTIIQILGQTNLLSKRILDDTIYNEGLMLKWNISQVNNQVIENAILGLYDITHSLTIGSANCNVSRANNNTWTSSVTASEMQAFIITNSFIRDCQLQTYSIWHTINVTDIIKTDVNLKQNFTTIRLESQTYPVLTITDLNIYIILGCYGDGTTIMFEDELNTWGSGNYPYLNITYASADISIPSFSTIPYNSTTTNQSATITWTPSESANYTLRYTTSTDYTGGTLISNATSLSTQRDVSISPLVNYTAYYINVSIWDTTGNYNQSNFSFRTNQNTVVANSCSTCNILCSDNCVLSTNINCAAGAATVSGAGTLTGRRYLTNWQTLTISGGCVVQY